MIEKIKKYFKIKKQLIDEVGHLTHQIKLMQTHIVVQKEEILNLQIRINELERENEILKNLLDIASNTKRY